MRAGFVFLLFLFYLNPSVQKRIFIFRLGCWLYFATLDQLSFNPTVLLNISLSFVLSLSTQK